MRTVEEPPPPAPLPVVLPEPEPVAVFKPEPTWQIQNKDTKGNVTEYIDTSGVRHYTPYSGNWQAGFKTDVELRKAQEQTPEGDYARFSPYVTDKNAEGQSVQIERAMEEKLEALYQTDSEQLPKEINVQGLADKNAECFSEKEYLSMKEHLEDVQRI